MSFTNGHGRGSYPRKRKYNTSNHGKKSVMETNNLHDLFGEDAIREFRRATVTVDWSDPALSKIIRLRLISDPGFPFWDLSYCWGILKDGTKVKVAVPLYQVPKNNVKGFIIEQAKKDGVFAKGLGIFDAISKCQ